MTTLLNVLKSRHPMADERVILHYILKGFVRRGDDIITNPDFPVRDETALTFESEYLVDKPMEYWVMREIDERWMGIGSISRILGIEMTQAHVDYILDKKAEVVVLNFRSGNMADFVETHVGNLFLEDFSRRLAGLFDGIISFLASNPLRVMGVVERYADKVREGGTIVIAIECHEDLENVRESYGAIGSAIGLSLKASSLLEVNERMACLVFER